jgi:hypothetical protein
LQSNKIKLGSAKIYTHDDDSSWYLILPRRRDEVVLSAELDKRSEQSDMEQHEPNSVQKGSEAFAALV